MQLYMCICAQEVYGYVKVKHRTVIIRSEAIIRCMIMIKYPALNTSLFWWGGKGVLYIDSYTFFCDLTRISYCLMFSVLWFLPPFFPTSAVAQLNAWDSM